MGSRGFALLILGSLVGWGAACGGDDEGPSQSAMVIEKPAVKSGDEQTGPVGTALGNPLRVLITRDGEPMQGVEVNWSADQGGFISSPESSDEFGIATAIWTLGPEVGNQVAMAEVADADNSPLTYTATAEPDEPPGGVTVQVLPNNTFAPATVTIPPGQSVTWEWAEGSGLHNVVPDNVEPASSGPLAEGPKTYTFTFTEPGTYRYHCQAHGSFGGIGMSGIVVVQVN